MMNLASLESRPPWEWPQSAGATLKSVLRDHDASGKERLLAAGMASTVVVMDEELAGLLLEIVSSPGEPEELRARSAISLGPTLEQTDVEGFDDPWADPLISSELFDRIRETLQRIHNDESVPKEVRRRVLEAAVRAPQEWQDEAILRAYSTGDEKWTLTAVFCMGWINGFEKEILESLNSANPDIHREAVQSAGSREVDAAWPHVSGLLTSKTTPKPLLLAAIEAAALIRPDESRKILKKLGNSKDPGIREAVADALMEMDLDDLDDDDD